MGLGLFRRVGRFRNRRSGDQLAWCRCDQGGLLGRVAFGLLGAFGTPSQLAFSGRLWAWATLAMLGVAAFMLALHATLTFRKRARRRPTPKIELRIGSSRPGGAL